MFEMKIKGTILIIAFIAIEKNVSEILSNCFTYPSHFALHTRDFETLAIKNLSNA